MDVVPRSNFDPTKILGPYPLLAAFLLVIETLLGFWFFRAESSFERIVAGLLMVLVVGGFLYAVIRVGSQKQEESAISPHGLGTVTPASEEVTAKQIEVPESEKIVAPDRSYTINRPPNDWIIRELTEAEWKAENLGVSDPAIKQELAGGEGQTSEILVIQTKTMNSLIPIPGKTTIDGAKVPTALETPLLTQLAIIPMNRAQPPFFVERPFAHNFLQAVSEIFRTNVMTLTNSGQGIIPNTQRQQMTAEFRQTIQYSLLNGNEVKEIAYSMLLIGIEGDIRDYILIVKYPSLLDTDDARLNQELQVIQSLISSFRPVKILNPEKQLREFRERSERYSKELMAKAGDVFFAEFAILLYRISGLDLGNPENRLRVMKLLKPFKTLSDQANLQDEQILALWDALQEAEKGDASEFKRILTELIGLAKASKESETTLNDKNHDVAASQGEGEILTSS